MLDQADRVIARATGEFDDFSLHGIASLGGLQRNSRHRLVRLPEVRTPWFAGAELSYRLPSLRAHAGIFGGALGQDWRRWLEDDNPVPG